MFKLVIEDDIGCDADLFKSIYKKRSLDLIFYQINNFLNDEMKTVQFKLPEDDVYQYFQTHNIYTTTFDYLQRYENIEGTIRNCARVQISRYELDSLTKKLNTYFTDSFIENRACKTTSKHKLFLLFIIGGDFNEFIEVYTSVDSIFQLFEEDHLRIPYDKQQILDELEANSEFLCQYDPDHFLKIIVYYNDWNIQLVNIFNHYLLLIEYSKDTGSAECFYDLDSVFTSLQEHNIIFDKQIIKAELLENDEDSIFNKEFDEAERECYSFQIIQSKLAQKFVIPKLKYSNIEEKRRWYTSYFNVLFDQSKGSFLWLLILTIGGIDCYCTLFLDIGDAIETLDLLGLNYNIEQIREDKHFRQSLDSDGENALIYDETFITLKALYFPWQIS